MKKYTQTIINVCFAIFITMYIIQDDKLNEQVELLNEELKDDDEDNVSSTLTLEFVKFWNNQAVDLSNEKRMDLLYAMLCYATDQTILREDGMINFNATPTDLDHDAMRKQGVYRKFLA